MKVKNLVLAVLFGTLVASGVVNAATNPWGEYGQNAQNTGMSNYTGAPNTDYSWNVPLSYDNRETSASPVVDSSGTVYILDAKSYGYQGTWELVDGKWIFTGEKPFLKAISPSGGFIWSKEVLPTCSSQIGRTSLALGNDGSLFLLCGERYWSVIYSVNSATGSTRWELQLDWYDTESVGNFTVDSQNRLYFVSTKRQQIDGIWRDYQSLTSVSGMGNILWSVPLGEGGGYNMSGPVLSNDETTVYIYRQDRNYDGAIIEAINTETGSLDWSLPLEWGGTGWQTFTSFTVDGNGTIWLASYFKDDPNYCYGRGEYLIGISPSGAISHKLPFKGDIDCGSHIRVGPSGTIYLTYDDARPYYHDGTRWIYWNSYWQSWYYYDYGYILVAGDPPPPGGLAAYDPVDGLKWRFELPDSYEANASPAIDAAENIYFAASFGERLYSINKDGQLNWMYDIAPGVEPGGSNWNVDHDQFTYGVAPVIGRAGSIYVMGSNNLYAINNDIDNDGISNNKDNCISVANTDQADRNNNGIGDACDGDIDGDTIVDTRDNCPAASNLDQLDTDGDGTGDVCDACISDPQNNCLNSSSLISTDITQPVTVSNYADTASVTIEPGDISTDTSITVTGETSTSNFALGSNQQVLGAIYTFAADPPSTFSSPVTITLKYDQGTMPEGGMTEQNLDIYYYDTATLTWVPQNAIQEMVNNTLTLNISHFSSYAVVTTENPISDLSAALKEISIENSGTWASLFEKISYAYNYYEQGDLGKTKETLNAFINELKALSGKKLDSTSADMLIRFAIEIMAKL